MLNGEPQIFSERRGGSESQHITKVIPHIHIHIRREKHLGLLTTYFLPRKITEGFQDILNGYTIFLVSFSK